MTTPKSVTTLLTARRLEQVPADRPSAQLRLARAEEKPTSEYQRIRRRRNKSEYDDITIGIADLTADLAHAAAVIQAVRDAL